MQSFAHAFLAFFFCFNLCAQAYWLEPSCATHPQADPIQQAINRAFALAGSTATLLNSWAVGSAQPDADDIRLFNLILGPAPYQTARDIYGGVATGRLPNGNLAPIHTFEPTKNRQGAGMDQPTWLSISCNMNWLKTKRVRGQEVLADPTSYFGVVASKLRPNVCRSAYAVTLPESATKANPNKRNPRANMVLCPWFAAQAGRQQLPGSDTWLRKFYVVIKGVNKLRSMAHLGGQDTSRKAVDRFALPDAIILHELTHTAQGRYRDDVAGDRDSYEWENIKRIGASDKIRNADNLMYFAIAMRLKYPQPGGVSMVVMDDGSVV